MHTNVEQCRDLFYGILLNFIFLEMFADEERHRVKNSALVGIENSHE